MLRRAVAVAAALALAGCLGADLDPAGAVDDALDGATTWPIVMSFDDTLTALPAGAPVELAWPFEVPEGAQEIRVHAAFESEHADVFLTLRDPSGGEVGRGFAETPTTRAFATTGTPAAGGWEAVVRSERALDEPVAVTVTVSDATATWQTIEETYRIAPRVPVRELATLQHGGYAEVNLILEPGQGFDYSWSSSGNVYFNIHYHADGVTERAVEERTDRLDGNFTAPIPQVYSLLWRNEGTTDVTVEATVDGEFREHSRTR